MRDDGGDVAGEADDRRHVVPPDGLPGEDAAALGVELEEVALCCCLCVYVVLFCFVLGWCAWGGMRGGWCGSTDGRTVSVVTRTGPAPVGEGQPRQRTRLSLYFGESGMI